jgi:hypothetical protein
MIQGRSVKKADIRIACLGSGVEKPHNLIALQGDLKELTKENYRKLRTVILKYGFSEPISIWRDPKGVCWILNGHQRIRTVMMMISEGYACPLLPVSEVEAADIDEAKRKLLAFASQYGRTDDEGLYAFLNQSDITPEEMQADYHFADLEIPGFIDSYFNDKPPEDPEPRGKSEHTCPECGAVF